MTEVFFKYCQQFDPCMPTPCFTAGNSDHAPVSSNVCMPETVAFHPHRSNQIQIIVRTQAHSDLMPDNAGATQATVIVLWEKRFWCVDMATRILLLIP